MSYFWDIIKILSRVSNSCIIFYWIIFHIYSILSTKMFTSANYTHIYCCTPWCQINHMNGMKVGHLSSDCHVVKTQKTKNSCIIDNLKAYFSHVLIYKFIYIFYYLYIYHKWGVQATILDKKWNNQLLCKKT